MPWILDQKHRLFLHIRQTTKHLILISQWLIITKEEIVPKLVTKEIRFESVMVRRNCSSRNATVVGL